MLRTYPEGLLRYAVDGVVQAASVGCASDHHRLETCARQRARQEGERAQAEAEALRGQALAEGYRDGLRQAMTALLPLIEALQNEQQHLVDAVRGHLHERLQAMTADPAVLVPQWTAACERWVTGVDTPAVLHVPQAQPALVQALATALAGTRVTVQPAPRQTPALHVGRLAYTLDMHAPLTETVDEALQRHLPALHARLDALARSYCQSLQADLANAHHRRRFAALEAPDDH
ncbi:hypothetical protein [Stenotrophomonas sp. NPDC077659]|uniref:hypothetical protein n=1 Tax=Stenotrophomonas sp. NPDC077659 TaxID=3390694 RepID=UPI003D001AC9